MSINIPYGVLMFQTYHLENTTISLKTIKIDIRDLNHDIFNGIETVIHLANIANDPAVELNPTLSWEVNVLAGQQLIEKAKNKQLRSSDFLDCAHALSNLGMLYIENFDAIIHPPNSSILAYVDWVFIRPMFGPSGVSIGQIRPQ